MIVGYCRTICRDRPCLQQDVWSTNKFHCSPPITSRDAKAAIHSVAAGDGAVHGAAAGGFGFETRDIERRLAPCPGASAAATDGVGEGTA